MRFALAAAVPLFLTPLDAFPQTSGALRGVVTDERQAPLPGVVIVVRSVTLGIGDRGGVTDASGGFLIPALPPARDYEIHATLQGFAGLTLSDVEVAAGRIAPLRLTLVPESAVRERVEVRARPGVVDLADTTTQTQLSSEFVDALPILGRDYQDVLTLAPGVTDVNGDGNPNIHGARETDMITLVDGVSTTDPLTGKIGAQLNIESIQEIQIKTSGASAEFGRAQGGFADIVTKSGGNDLQGTLKFFWRGSTLDGDGAGIDPPALHAAIGESGLRDLKFNDYTPFLSVGGPIVKDHAWFFVANERIVREDPVNALNSAFLRGVREWREFLKLTWQASATERLALSINYDPQDYLNEGLNSFTREESGYTQHAGGTIVTAKATSVLGPLVALETSASFYDQKPAILPNLGLDTNGDGTLWIDRNQNHFFEASERDPGEDYDADGRFDVFEDANLNGRLEFGEDIDGDGHLTPYRRSFWAGCEGPLREDQNCNGRLDFNEDGNNNGILDPGEDSNGDGVLTPSEDRNHNGVLDDTPFPASLYPYGELRPRPGDRDYSIDRNTGVVSGPYYQESSDARQRFTLKQDLSVYLPAFRGTHDLKIGASLEREAYRRNLGDHAILSPRTVDCEPPVCQPVEGAPLPPPLRTISVLLPAETAVHGEASALSGGLYVQDSYRPVPNLNLGFGMRFDREVDNSVGYSFFDPRVEGRGFERLVQLGGYGGGSERGILADPLFSGEPDIRQAAGFITDPLQIATLSRLTRHHDEVAFDSGLLHSLGIIPSNGQADPAQLLASGVNPQTRELFSISNNNLAPRLSLSWDPWADGRCKLFGTWGRYYDKLFLSTITGEQGPDTINRYYFYDADGLSSIGQPDARIGTAISKSPPSTTQVDRQLATPFSDELTVGFEREIAPEIALSVTYIERHFRRQLQDVDLNHTLRYDPQGRPLDAIGALDFIAGPRGIEFATPIPVPDGRPDLYIQNIFFNQVLRVGNSNEARYGGIEVALTRRLARRWQMQGSYVYSRAVGDAEDFQSRLGNDPSTVESETGYLDYDQRHVVKLNTSMYLPDDWQIGGSTTWSSGLPYSIISRFFALDNIGYEQFRTRYGYTAQIPGVGQQFVALRRNSERNAAVLDVNLSVRKNVVLGRRTAALSFEVFNLLNRDDLRIFTYEATPFTITGTTALTSLAPRGPLQVDGERRFGRRFQLGFKMDF